MRKPAKPPSWLRLQATGIYGNPNDLSRILVVGILLSLYFLGDRRLGLLRPLWLLPIGLFGLGLHLTHSRGGLLSLFAGIWALFYNRYGRAKTLLLGAMILPVLLVGFGGRQTNFSTSEGTGQERIKIWNDGFVLMQGSPVFGIGMNQYAEQLRIAAHNSFVHCYVELGFIGGTFFFALFYLPFLVPQIQESGSSEDPRSRADTAPPVHVRHPDRNGGGHVVIETKLFRPDLSHRRTVHGLLENPIRSRACLAATIQLESRRPAFFCQRLDSGHTLFLRASRRTLLKVGGPCHSGPEASALITRLE